MAEFLSSNGISACVFRDEEGRRDPSLRYLSGQHEDAVLIVTDSGKSALIAWDLAMAERNAFADSILPYSDYGRNLAGALSGLLPLLGLQKASRVEIPARTYYPEFPELRDAAPDFELVCGSSGSAAAFVETMRAVKDSEELAVIRKAAGLTDSVLRELERRILCGGLSSERQAALYLEEASRDLGCEGMGFETLCAGPDRSFGIHAFPAWTTGSFGDRGLSILDFGLKLQGYTTDVTLTVARGKLLPEQELMLDLVERAYEESIKAARNACPVVEPSRACDSVFSAAGWKMPHSLGHGIGLEAHEAPILRDRPGNDWIFRPGMVFTVEPGLYHPEFGGVRLENDFIMTERGPERITDCRILRIG